MCIGVYEEIAVKLSEEYIAALDLVERESDRFWARNNVFLLVQGAMIAFYSKANTGLTFGMLVSAEGFFLALIWIGVLRKGAHYVSRWDKVAREIERRLEERNGSDFIGLKRLNDLAKAEESPAQVRFLNRRTTILIRYFIVSLLIFWLLLIICNVVAAVRA